VPLEIGRVGQHREARRATQLVGDRVFGRAEVGPDQAFGGRSFLDFGDKAEARRGLGLERPAEPARRRRLGGLAVEVFECGERLARGYFLALGGADFGELVHRVAPMPGAEARVDMSRLRGRNQRVLAIQQSSKALASPLSIASAASSAPSVQVSTSPATSRAPAALNSTASR